MSTTVRGAAHARRAANLKHQQRTPLPPKGSVQKSPADLEAERAEERAAIIAAPAVVSKAGAFAAEAEAHGWKVERTVSSNAKIVTATRGIETITATWIDNKSARPLGEHRIGDSYAEKFMHVTVAKKLLSAEAVVEAPVRKVSERKIGVKAGPVRRRVPFDPATASDKEVLAAVKGRKLVWVNSISGEHEEARVPVNGKATRLDIDRLLGEEPEHRTLTFVDADRIGGYRSLVLSALVRVS